VVEVDPLLGDTELGKLLALRGEVLLIRGAAGVADHLSDMTGSVTVGYP
jgi:hypothetical protein